MDWKLEAVLILVRLERVTEGREERASLWGPEPPLARDEEEEEWAGGTWRVSECGTPRALCAGLGLRRRLPR